MEKLFLTLILSIVLAFSSGLSANTIKDHEIENKKFFSVIIQVFNGTSEVINMEVREQYSYQIYQYVQIPPHSNRPVYVNYGYIYEVEFTSLIPHLYNFNGSIRAGTDVVYSNIYGGYQNVWIH